MFDLITQSIIFLLESLKAVLGDYGWAIIALTVLVRAVLWPVSRSQMKAMKAMQELQPKMKSIQERYKTDPQKMQAEMMKLYKDHKFNPLGGCLPMLVQLPLFLGLYWAISNPQFMTGEDPTWLNMVHLKHTGIITHAGRSNDGEMSVSEGGGGFFFGLGGGSDAIVAGERMTVVLKNGKTLEDVKIPDAGKALKVVPKEARPGIPLKLSATFERLGLEGYEGQVDRIDLSVINNATKEMERIRFTPRDERSTVTTTLETTAGKTAMNIDVLVLVIIFAVTMIISQRMMTAQAGNTGNEQQQQMMKFLPIMFSIFLFIFPIPAGVLLYMDTNSLFQIFQTWVFQREKDAAGKSNPPSQRVLDIKPDSP